MLQPVMAAQDPADERNGDTREARIEPAVLFTSMEIVPEAAERGPLVLKTASSASPPAGVSKPGSAAASTRDAGHADGLGLGPRSIYEAAMMAVLIAVLLVLAGLNGLKRPLRPLRSAPQEGH